MAIRYHVSYRLIKIVCKLYYLIKHLSTYQVLEQKQETSWTSSRHWFTSRVVKCADIGKYGAILDNNTVAVWNEDDTAMGDVTKMKVSQSIISNLLSLNLTN